ncbi:hypothetical protein AALP_AA3G159200 [Arabis alpina]|uniref:Uncharacterized protein n=1 Tax=Arabis alpina TaxID=50452 RepID=A0A087H9H7_ARAAL|nr:hypothetical protein AALP_AA3G159200 [Arabis alpina]
MDLEVELSGTIISLWLGFLLDLVARLSPNSGFVMMGRSSSSRVWRFRRLLMGSIFGFLSHMRSGGLVPLF